MIDAVKERPPAVRRLSTSFLLLALLAAAASLAFAQPPPPAPRAAQNLRIMPLGDSITYGVPNPRYGGYRHLLGTLLTRDGYRFEFVGSQPGGQGLPLPANEGHPGWTIQRLKKGIDSQGWLETYRPDIILLHIGTNDLRPNIHRAASAPGDLSALLDDILQRLPNARIIVAQIIPFRSGPDDVHRAYNAAIPGIVASKGDRVSLVDMQNLLSAADYSQGLHPNTKGYDKMARAWERALRPVLNASGKRPAPR